MIRPVLAGLAVAVIGASLLAPTPAQAYWVRSGWAWRAPVVVVPPPVLVGPPRVYVAAPRPAYWVHPHYNRWGAFIPGHWQ